MKLHPIITVATILCIGIFGLRACAQMPLQKATIEVTDQDGKPVKDALVEMGFWGGPSGTEFGSRTCAKNKTTTETGIVAIEGGNSVGDSGIRASKDGYYKASTKYIANRVVNRRWEPWNPTVKLQLKEIRKPIPMYAFTTRDSGVRIWAFPFPREFPVGPVGFDLMAHDWVEPNGKGKVVDVMLERLEPKVPEGGNVLIMRFVKPSDGIIGPYVNDGKNTLKSTHEAPVGSYKTEVRFDNLDRRQVVSPGEVDVTERWFAFRIRTVVDADGKVVSTHYGKIYGYPEVFRTPKASSLTRLCYYINPTPNSRNLEWDQKTNLFTDLDKLNWPDNP